ncbi:MAG: hypothetical protein JNM50_10920 [Chromatiales bacterium]|nr:hypothetical protein [Chromatiales bacterium]
MGRQATTLLPAPVAALLLAFAPAAPALEIGELVAGSQLGQPLSARVAVSLAAGESLDAGCVSVSGTGAGLPAVAGLGATVVPAVGPATASISLDSPRPLAEPAYGLTVRVACPGMPSSQREFVFIPDLPGTGTASVPASAATSSAPPLPAMPGPADTATTPDPARDGGAAPVTAAPARTLTPLAPGERYLVQTGETLWSIAVRATGAGGSPRLTAAAIHAANRDAFLGGDPARLMAGATLVMPAEAAAVPAVARSGSDAPAVPARAATPTDIGNSPADGPVASDEAAGPVDEPAAATGDAGATSKANDTSGPVAPAAEVGGAALAAAALPAPEAAVAPAPAPRPRPARQPPAAAPARSPQQSGAEPLVSALAGAAFGLLAGSPFWWRSRRRSTAAEEPAREAAPVKVAMPATAAEPAIAVSFEPLPAVESTVAGASVAVTGAASGTWPRRSEETTRSQRLRPADDITSELEELFNTAPGEAAGDTTGRRSWTPGAGMIDLPALAEGSDTDEHQAQGLRDALALLERDYEQEWTGSRTGPVAMDPPAPEATPTAPIRRLG